MEAADMSVITVIMGGIVSLQIGDDETNKIREGEDGLRELKEETEDIKERGTID